MAGFRRAVWRHRRLADFHFGAGRHMHMLGNLAAQLADVVFVTVRGQVQHGGRSGRLRSSISGQSPGSGCGAAPKQPALQNASSRSRLPIMMCLLAWAAWLNCAGRRQGHTLRGCPWLSRFHACGKNPAKAAKIHKNLAISGENGLIRWPCVGRAGAGAANCWGLGVAMCCTTPDAANMQPLAAGCPGAWLR